MSQNDNDINHRGMKLLEPDSRLSSSRELSAIVEAIFTKKHHFTLPDGTRLHTRAFVNGAVVGVDYNLHRYLEQNPNKKTPEAARARAGAKIVHVLRTHDPATGKEYAKSLWVGKIEDGIVRVR